MGALDTLKSELAEMKWLPKGEELMELHLSQPV
jgi:hypothetical protein